MYARACTSTVNQGCNPVSGCLLFFHEISFSDWLWGMFPLGKWGGTFTLLLIAKRRVERLIRCPGECELDQEEEEEEVEDNKEEEGKNAWARIPPHGSPVLGMLSTLLPTFWCSVVKKHVLSPHRHHTQSPCASLHFIQPLLSNSICMKCQNTKSIFSKA